MTPLWADCSLSKPPAVPVSSVYPCFIQPHCLHRNMHKLMSCALELGQDMSKTSNIVSPIPAGMEITTLKNFRCTQPLSFTSQKTKLQELRHLRGCLRCCMRILCHTWCKLNIRPLCSTQGSLCSPSRTFPACSSAVKPYEHSSTHLQYISFLVTARQG